MTDDNLSTGDRLTRLEGEVSGLKDGFRRMEGILNDLARTVSQRERTNWPVLLTVVGLFLSLVTIFAGIAIPSVGAFLLFTDLRSTNLVAQLRFQEIAPLTASAEVSRRDREELHGQMLSLVQTVSEINSRERESTASLRAANVEIESQFASSDHIRNLQNAHNIRLIAMLWEKVYGQRFPSDVQFYPNISQHER